MAQPPGLEQNRATLGELVRHGERQAFIKLIPALAARAERDPRQPREISVARAVHIYACLLLPLALGAQAAQRDAFHAAILGPGRRQLRIEQQRQPLLP